jgi:hypothetical protein
LAAHLGDGDPDAWRAALRVLEHAFGRPGEMPEDTMPVDIDPLGVASMTQAQRAALIRSVIHAHPSLIALIPEHGRSLVGLDEAGVGLRD